MFVDRAVIEVRGGVGGSGAEAFRRESGVPRGGPSGGDGGHGGHVVLEVDAQLTTLLDYSYKRHYQAPRGMHGEGSNRTGRSGEDLVLKVPPGTIAVDADTDEFLGDSRVRIAELQRSGVHSSGQQPAGQGLRHGARADESDPQSFERHAHSSGPVMSAVQTGPSRRG